MTDFGSAVPLESNPEVFTKFGHELGLSPLLSFCDIYSLTEPDLLAMLPRPLYSVILLFPVTKEYEDLRKKESNDSTEKDSFENVLWFKQLIRNACGLYGLLHSICNLPSGLIVDQSKIWNFIEDIHKLPGVNNSNMFVEKTKMILELSRSSYQKYSQEGQTEAPNAEESVDLHFVCFTRGKDGHFYELDGRRNGPIDLGDASDALDVLDSKAVLQRVKTYMKLAGNSMEFSMMGLGPIAD